MNVTSRFDTPDGFNSMQTRFNSEPYEPPESLWQLIKSVANERELDIIKSIIGSSLIETSLDLHSEIDTLLEIWRDYRNETEYTLNEIDIKNSKNFALPEPPNIRETLKKEINFFVKQMREQYKEDEHFRRQIATNNHNLNVINYVLNSALNSNDSAVKELSSDSMIRVRSRSVSERPVTAIDKRTGNETPVLANSEGRQSRQRVRYRSVSRASSLNSPRAQLKTVNSNYDDLNVPNTLSENLEQYVDEDKINCMQIDEIADHLRELLQQECDVLLKDIEFLYECIDQERDYRETTHNSAREPSLNELKEERKRLEIDLVSATSRNAAKISKLPSNLTHSKNNRSINSPLIRASPPTSASSTRSKISLNDVSVNEQTNKPIVKRATSLTKKTETLKTPTTPTTNSKSGNTKMLNTLTIRRSTTNNSTIPQKSFTKPLNSMNTKLINNHDSKTVSNGKMNSNTHNELNIKPILSRTNSASSIASSVASSISSGTSSKLSAVQKFRQMVLESRND